VLHETLSLERTIRVGPWLLFAAWCVGLAVPAGLIGLSLLKPAWGPDRLFVLSENISALYFVLVFLLVVRGRRGSREIRPPAPFARAWFLACLIALMAALAYAALGSGAGEVTRIDDSWYRIGDDAPMPITAERAIAYMWGNVRLHSTLMLALGLAGLPLFAPFRVLTEPAATSH
jgi:hypothetical protein